MALLSARRSTMRNLQRGSVSRILVVCYGNINRSPFVSLLLQQCVGPEIAIRSAGFHAVPDRPSPARHVRSCERYGVSLRQHRSGVITQADVQWADLIVLMDRANWAALARIGARFDKLVWLGAFLPGNIEVADPFKLDDAAADRIVDTLYTATQSLATCLKSKATHDS